jgi:multicomponent Na+:H+ antiporter subunit A
VELMLADVEGKSGHSSGPGSPIEHFPAILAVALTVAFTFAVPRVAAGEVLTGGWEWLPLLGIRLSFRIDGLSLLFALLITGIGAVIAVYARGYLGGHRDLGRFQLVFMLFMASMLGLVLADDVIALFVFWELTSLTSFVLIGFDHERENARRAALQALLITAGGGLALLAGLVMLGNAAGTYSISEMIQAGVLPEALLASPAIVLLIAAGAMTKSAIFPFHFWLPNAMEAPTPVSAYLHSATMVKAGVYLVARMSPLLGASVVWTTLLTVAGALTGLFAAAVALRQYDLKRILAWSTVSALGLITFLLALDDPKAAGAAIVFLVAHALYKAALFMAAGTIDHETGSRDIRLLRGLGRRMPIVMGAALLAVASMAGLPPVIGFLSKEGLYAATIATGEMRYVWTGVAILTSILLVAVGLRVSLLPLLGRADSEERLKVPWTLWVPPALLSVAGLMAGLLLSRWVGALMDAAAFAATLSPAAEPMKLWHGVGPELILGIATLIAGALLTLALGRRTSVAEGLTVADRVYDKAIGGLMAFASLQTRILQNGYLRHYLAVILGFALLLISIPVVAGGIPRAVVLTTPFVLDVATLGLMVGGALLALLARSRFAAIVSFGAVGIGLSLVFMLNGAPDLAMTQIVVDILTVMVFMLAFHRLPQLASYSKPAARRRDVVLASLFGIAMGVLAFRGAVSTTLEPISMFFSENALEAAHGLNIVNVILVDFRALDTLGEIAVLMVAAFGAYALLKLRPHEEERE